MTTFLAGETLTAAKLNAATMKTLARGQRVTAKTPVTSETGVLNVPDVPMLAGRLYRVAVGPIYVTSTSGTDDWIARMRYTVDGSDPLLSSAVLDLAIQDVGQTATMEAYISDAVDRLFSVTVTIARQAGGGTLTYDGTVQPMRVVIQDIGVDPGNSGVAL